MKCNCCCTTKKWHAGKISDQSGRNVVVTGANSGIGYHTALELGRTGADVVIAVRDAGRGAAAVQRLQQEAPGVAFRMELLDLSDLLSVRLFAERWLANGKPLDILVNNAGIMAIPQREETVDGFEKQLASNHLGHFALTGLLLPALQQSAAPRVVTVSSKVADFSTIDLTDLQSRRSYTPMGAYGQSKVANLAFMLELGRRLPWLTSVAAHPGATISNLQQYQYGRIIRIIGQQGAEGALPSLRAAVDETRSGQFYGPQSWFQMRGAPVEVNLPRSARDTVLNSAVWEESVRLTGVGYHC